MSCQPLLSDSKEAQDHAWLRKQSQKNKETAQSAKEKGQLQRVGLHLSREHSRMHPNHDTMAPETLTPGRDLAQGLGMLSAQ